jgi:hypothetical protein
MIPLNMEIVMNYISLLGENKVLHEIRSRVKTGKFSSME